MSTGRAAEGAAEDIAAADAASLQAALAPLVALPAVGWLLLRALKEPDITESAAGRTSDAAQRGSAVRPATPP